MFSLRAYAQDPKAIIIAGSTGPDDLNRSSFSYLADKAYQMFANHGFSDDQIQYLSFESGVLVDDDSHRSAFEDAKVWSETTGQLFVYLVGHGSIDGEGLGTFHLNETNHIEAEELNNWFKQLELSANDTEITMILDCCHAASFIPLLGFSMNAKRVVIASCREDEAALFMDGGQCSYSSYFFQNLNLSNCVGYAYDKACSAMSDFQSAQIINKADANVRQIGLDGAVMNPPIIGQVSPDTVVQHGESSSGLIWVDNIMSEVDIQDVQCWITGTNSVSYDYDMHEMGVPGHYELDMDHAWLPGISTVHIRATDINGMVSDMATCHVFCEEDNKRCLMIVGSGHESDGRVYTNGICEIYHALQDSFKGRERIKVLYPEADADIDGDAVSDVDGIADLVSVSNMLYQWAVEADEITLYLTGPALQNQGPSLNDQEFLDLEELNGWLYDLQATSNQLVTVIIDTDYSGHFLEDLVPPPQHQRVLISSASETEQMDPGVDVALFSSLFFEKTRIGCSAGQAFCYARDMMEDQELSQHPVIMDDGDSIPNEIYEEGLLADVTWVGYTSHAGELYIGSIISNSLIEGLPEIPLWASGIYAVAGVSNVWCEVVPWGCNSGEVEFFEELEWNSERFQYEGTFCVPESNVSYTAHFYVSDLYGNVSDALNADLITLDPYEVDDDYTQASQFPVRGTQRHNFHDINDQDWLRFFAASGHTYYVETQTLDPNVQLNLELYYFRDGELELVDDCLFGESFSETGVEKWTALDLFQGELWQEGYYYLRISPVDSVSWGANSAYDVSIYMPEGALLTVMVIDEGNLQCLYGAQVLVDRGVQSAEVCYGSNICGFDLAPETLHELSVQPPSGYIAAEDPALPNQPDNPDSLWYGNPRLIDLSALEAPYIEFRFIPEIYLAGMVKDAWSQERVSDVSIVFHGDSGHYADYPVNKYPHEALWGEIWVTDENGVFPSQVILPKYDGYIVLSKEGYEPLVISNIMVGVSPGDMIDVGMLEMTPLDDDGDGIADNWEDHYFSGSIEAGDDADGDGVCNLGEYMAGTDPCDPQSHFSCQSMSTPSGNELTLIWPVSSGKTYVVKQSETLVNAVWSIVYGPTTATLGQEEMQWTSPDAASHESYYRIEIVPPES